MKLVFLLASKKTFSGRINHYNVKFLTPQKRKEYKINSSSYAICVGHFLMFTLGACIKRKMQDCHVFKSRHLKVFLKTQF